jgi:hypothetical protein
VYSTISTACPLHQLWFSRGSNADGRSPGLKYEKQENLANKPVRLCPKSQRNAKRFADRPDRCQKNKKMVGLNRLQVFDFLKNSSRSLFCWMEP